MSQDNGQRRAKAGGEFGANGEWYEGGKFIATKDNPKGEAPERKPSAPWSDEWQRREAAKQEWLAPRVERFAAILSDLDAQPHGSYLRELGTNLRQAGCLYERQAEAVVKFHMGRRVKANAAAWDALADDLSQGFTWVE